LAATTTFSDVLESLGVTRRFAGVALKPGKPLSFGTRGATLVFGLAGNPVSSLVTFLLFGRPALQALAGESPQRARTVATLDEDWRTRALTACSRALPDRAAVRRLARDHDRAAELPHPDVTARRGCVRDRPGR